jgi:hypothetical protein
MKLLVMQSSPVSRHVLLLRSKYSPQHPFPKQTSICVPSLVRVTKFNTRTKQQIKIIVLCILISKFS